MRFYNCVFRRFFTLFFLKKCFECPNNIDIFFKIVFNEGTKVRL
jgi:hypothetical protein